MDIDRLGKGRVLKAVSLVALFVVALLDIQKSQLDEFNVMLQRASVSEVHARFDPPKCSAEQLEKISSQLPPDECIENKHRPWTSRCSFSAASSCPEAPWLDHHFAARETNKNEEPFLSFFVGCNKAIDAVHALRMGSRNPRFDVEEWKKKLSQGRENEFAQSSCAQFDKDYGVQSQQNIREAQVYCFEPVSSTFAQLHRTKMELGWTNELVLEEAAVSSERGALSVPKEVALGRENAGIDQLNCGKDGDVSNCRKIPIYTLNDYVGTMPGKPHIHFLSIDVEGYDFEVLKGASNILREQVHYLEFEYNWKGGFECFGLLHGGLNADILLSV
jgi:FkbM family methyltransferase